MYTSILIYIANTTIGKSQFTLNIKKILSCYSPLRYSLPTPRTIHNNNNNKNKHKNKEQCTLYITQFWSLIKNREREKKTKARQSEQSTKKCLSIYSTSADTSKEVIAMATECITGQMVRLIGGWVVVKVWLWSRSWNL